MEGDKVQVSIRVRPLIQRERDAEESINWKCEANVIHPLQFGSQSQRYNFDRIFGPEAGTEEVYKTVVSQIVEKSLQGYNGTVLCYGQTSSGKTHTLYGTADQDGIISLTAKHLFHLINNDQSRTYYIRVGLVEVYNEKVTDLLNNGAAIEIREKDGVVYPEELKELDVVSPQDMLKAAKTVQAKRRIGETQMNKESSRSHTILRIIVESVPNDNEEEDEFEEKEVQVTNALLNFVDLAGSEKASQTGAVGERFKEATYINKSLSVLSSVVFQLSKVGNGTSSSAHNSSNLVISSQASCQSQAKLPPPKYVNYRDSKLTRILQGSLSGNAYISLICNVTPAAIDETHSTLRFARTAKNMKMNPVKNEGPPTGAQYRTKITELESMLVGKTSELENLRKQIANMQKFCQPIQRPAISLQPDRRKTMCPSMLRKDPGVLESRPIIDDFKIPSLPIRHSVSHAPSFIDASAFSPFNTSKRTEKHRRPARDDAVVQIKPEMVDVFTETDFVDQPGETTIILEASKATGEKWLLEKAHNQSIQQEWFSEKSFLQHEFEVLLEEKDVNHESTLAELKTLLEHKNIENKKILEECENLKRRNATLEKEVREHFEELHTIKSKMRKSDTENIALKEGLKEFEDTKLQLAQLQSEYHEKQRSQDESKEQAEKLHDMEKSRSELASENELLKQERTQVASDLKALQDKCADFLSENGKLVSQLEAITVESKSHQDCLAEVKGKYQLLELELQETKSSRGIFEAQCQQLSQNLAQAEEKLEALRLEKDKDISSWKSQHQDLSLSLEDANKELSKLQARLISTESEAEKLMNTVIELEKVKAEYNHVTSSHQNLKEKLDAAEAEIMSTKRELQLSADQLVAVNVEMTVFKEESKLQLEVMQLSKEKEESEWQSKCEKLTAESEEAKKEVEEFQAKLNRCESEVQNLLNISKQLEILREEHSKVLCYNEELQEKLKLTEEKVKAEYSQVTSSHQNLKEKLDAAEAEIMSTKRELQLSADQLAAINVAMAVFKEESKLQLEAMRLSKEKDESEWQSKCEKITAESEEAKKEVEEFQAKLNRCESEVQNLLNISKQLEILREEHSKVLCYNEELQEKLKLTEEEVDAARNSCQDTLEELQKVKSGLLTLEEEAKASADYKIQAEQDIATLEENLQTLRATLQNHEDVLQNYESVCSKLQITKNEKEELNAIISEQTDSVTSVIQERDSLKEQLASAQIQAEQMQDLIRLLEEKLKHSETQNASSNKALDEALQELEGVKSVLTMLREVESKYSQVVFEKEDLALQLQKLISENNKFLQYTQDVAEQYQALEAEMQQVTSSKEAVREMCEKTKQNLLLAEHQLEQLQEKQNKEETLIQCKYQQLSQDFEKAQNEIALLQQRLDCSEAQVKNFMETTQELETLKEDSKLSSFNASLVQKLEHAEAEQSSIQTDLQGALQQLGKLQADGAAKDEGVESSCEYKIKLADAEKEIKTLLDKIKSSELVLQDYEEQIYSVESVCLKLGEAEKENEELNQLLSDEREALQLKLEECDNVNQKLSALELELEELKTSKELINEDYQQLLAKLSQAEQQLISTSASHARIETEKLIGLEKLQTKLVSENNELKQQLEEVSTEKERLQEKCSGLLLENGDLISQLEKVSNDSKAHLKQMKEAADIYQSIQTELQEAKSSKEVALQQCKQLEDFLSQAKQEFDHLRSEKTSLSSELQSRYEELALDFENLQAERSQLQHKLIFSSSEAEKLKESVQQLEKLKEENCKLITAEEALQQKLQFAQAQQISTIKTLEDITEELATVKLNLSEQEAAFCYLQTEKEGIAIQLERVNLENQSEIMALKEQLEEYNQIKVQAEKLQLELVHTQDLLQKSETEANQRQDKLEDLEKVRTELLSENTRFRREHSQNINAIQKLKQELEDLQQKLSSSHQVQPECKCQETKAKYSELVSEKQDLACQLQKAMSENRRHLNYMEEVAEQYQSLESELKEIRSSKKIIEEQCELLKQKLSQAEEHLTNVSSEKKTGESDLHSKYQKLSMDYENVQKELLKSKQKLEHSESEVKNMTSNMKQLQQLKLEHAELSKSKDELKDKLHCSEMEWESTNKSLLDAIEQLDKIKAKNNILEKEARESDQLKLRLAEAEKEVLSLQESIKSSQSKVQKHEELLQDYESVCSKLEVLQTKYQELDAVVSDQTQIILSKQEEYELLKTKLSSVERQLEEFCNKTNISELKAKYEQASVEVESLRIELQRKTAEYASLNERYQNKCENFEGISKEQVALQKNLHDRNSTLEIQLKKAFAEVQGLKEELVKSNSLALVHENCTKMIADLKERLQVEESKENKPVQPKPKLRSVAVETTSSIDIDKQRVYWQKQFDRSQYLLHKTVKELKNEVHEKSEEAKGLQKKLADAEELTSRLSTNVRFLDSELERCKEMVPPSVEKKEMGSQCDIIMEWMHRIKLGLPTKLPPEFPNFPVIMEEARNLRGEVAVLKSRESKCTCNKQGHFARPQAFVPDFSRRRVIHPVNTTAADSAPFSPATVTPAGVSANTVAQATPAATIPASVNTSGGVPANAVSRATTTTSGSINTAAVGPSNGFPRATGATLASVSTAAVDPSNSVPRASRNTSSVCPKAFTRVPANAGSQDTKTTTSTSSNTSTFASHSVAATATSSEHAPRQTQATNSGDAPKKPRVDPFAGPLLSIEELTWGKNF